MTGNSSRKKYIIYILIFYRRKKSRENPLKLIFLSNHPTCGAWTREAQDIQAWAKVLDGDVYSFRKTNVLEILKKYELIMVELNTETYELVKNIKKKYPSKKIFGVIEGSLHSYDNDHETDIRFKLVETYKEADILGALIADSISYLEAITNKPVYWLGVPFPLEWSQQHIINPAKKEPIVEIQNTFSYPKKGGFTSFFVLKGIEEKLPQVKGRFLSCQKGLDRAAAKHYKMRFQISPYMDWTKYFRHHSQSYIGLNLDYRWTWNRYSIDCAAAGIPCISTKNATTQRMLYPELCVDSFDAKKAIELAVKLFEDTGFYNKCRSFAMEKIKEFDYENSKKRFFSIMEKQKWI